MDSIFWFVTAVTLFVIALVTDAELRKEMKSIRTCSVYLLTVIALYSAIMWIVKEWLQWCM